MKKVGLKAIAAAMALLMTASLSAPAAAEAADKLLVTSAGGNVLVITQDMVDSEGEFVLSGEDFDKVVLPADVKIKNLYVDGCEIGEFTVEGGNNPKVQLWDAQIKNVTVSAANMIDENKAIAEFMEAMRNETSKDTDVEAFVKNVRETNERLAKLIPDIRLMGADMASSEQEIGEVTLAGNAKVNFTKGTNPGKVNVAFKSAQEEMNVTIEGYKGDINVEQTTSVDAPFGVLNLRTKKSEIGDVNVNTQGNANIVLRSTDSKAANVNFNSSGAGSTVLTLSAPTDNLKVAGSASNATVKVLTSLISADVQGKGINMNVGASASVEKATIGGTGNSVSGTGDLKDCTISDGATANVQVPGSTVAGNNTYTPSVFIPSIIVPSVNPNPNPNPEPEPEPETPVGTSMKLKLEGENIILSPSSGQESEVTTNANTSVNKAGYKTAVWNFPSYITDENDVESTILSVSSVKITFSSDTQICIKVHDAAGNKLMDDAYPNYQVTEMTEATVTYDITDGTAGQIHFMSLEEDVNITVSKIEFDCMVATEGGNTEGGNTEGGNTEGGNTEGGNTEGGNTEGGNTEGGNTEDAIPVIKFADLTDGGYGYDVDAVNGSVVGTISAQYQEIQYTLPEAIDLSEYSQIVLEMESDAPLCIKLKDVVGGDPFAEAYTGNTVTSPNYITLGVTDWYDFTDARNRSLAQICFMSNAADAVANIRLTSMTFIKDDQNQGAGNEGGNTEGGNTEGGNTEDTESTIPVIKFAELTDGGYGYDVDVVNESVVGTISAQYQEIQYTLPEAINLAEYSQIVLEMESDAALCIKLKEEVGGDAFAEAYTGNTVTSPNYITLGVTDWYDFTDARNHSLAQICFMSNAADAVANISLTSMTFVK